MGGPHTVRQNKENSLLAAVGWSHAIAELVCALLGVLPPLARSETVIKILHIQTNPQILAIWEAAAQTYESAHPGVKVEFDYLEN